MEKANGLSPPASPSLCAQEEQSVSLPSPCPQTQLARRLILQKKAQALMGPRAPGREERAALRFIPIAGLLDPEGGDATKEHLKTWRLHLSSLAVMQV